MGKAKTIGVGMDYSATSKLALQWTFDNLIEAGDLVVVTHVLSPKSDPTNKQLFEDTGSPLIPLEEFREINVCKKYGLTPDAEVLDILHTMSKTKGAKVVAKVYWGDPREKLCDSVENLKLDSIVVGSRGLGAIKRVGIDLPTIEVRFKHLNVDAEAYVGGRALSTILNFSINLFEGFLNYLHVVPSRKKPLSILHDVSGIIKPGRVFLGSVSNHVVQNATCPVTVVKGPPLPKP